MVHPARPDQREAALCLIFQHLPADERAKRVANALHLIELGQLQADGLLVVSDPQGVRGAMVCLPVPGASGLVWPPTADTAEIEDALVRAASAWLTERGAKLGQALLSPDESHLAASLERNGFRHIAALWYMRCDSTVSLVGRDIRQRLTYLRYDSHAPLVFHQTLLRTYEGTRDCPEVNGVRTVAEIIDGHTADARNDLEHWWLTLVDEKPVGVVLVNESSEWETWEVAYVGVVPEARGQGFGEQMMLQAILEARTAEASQLTLSVDARNHPALALYHRLGFERYDGREVYLAVWSSDSSLSRAVGG